jgi:hypothetical protein
VGIRGKITVVVVVCLLLTAFFLGVSVTVREEIPENAMVVVTIEDKHYHAIHVDSDALAGKTAKTMPLSAARQKGFKPDPQSIDRGYFRGNRLFLYQYVLSKIGIHYNSRWDKNGNWLW